MGLEERLADAIATENFLAAATIRDEMRAVRRRDPRARCEDDLEEAIAREEYARAAKMRARLAELDRDAAAEALTPCERRMTTR